MKIIFLIFVVLIFVLTPVYGQLLSDATGLVNRLDVQTDGHAFEVETISNFNIKNFEFDKDEKKLTLYITSGLENNLGEVLIPQNLLGGNLTFYLNDQEYSPEIKINEKISFVTLNFTGSGENKLEIFATKYLFGLVEIEPEESVPLQKEDPLDYSLVWLALVGLLAIVAVFLIMKMKKKSQA